MKDNHFFKENRILIAAFILTTLFFLYQYYRNLNWDFTAYILNAKYLFSNGNYFEWFRDPFMPLLIGIFSIFTWKISPYIYIIFVSLLYLFSSIKFSEKFNIDKNIYYLISLSPFLLLEGLKNGTELLSLSLIQLFLAYFETSLSAVIFGLAFLTRYTSLGLLPLIIFLKKPRKIIIFLLIFFVVVSPWLIFNYIKTGNALSSIVDSYALNIAFRSYINDDFPLRGFLINFGHLLALSLLGFCNKFKRLSNKDFIMVLIILLTLISFYRIPVKSYTLRYLFFIITPLSYFSAIALQKIKKRFVFALFIISIIISSAITTNAYTDRIENYKQALPYLEKCSVYSNNWIYLNYLGKNTKPDLHEKQFKAKIENGERILMYYNNLENIYIKNETFLKDFPIIIRTDKFILLGNESKCNPDNKKIDMPYYLRVRDTVEEIYNYTEDISNCKILFKGKIPLVC